MHHRREGQLMTQTQEEMVLICGFGLFWIGEAECLAYELRSEHLAACLVAWRGWGEEMACWSDQCIVEEYRLLW